MATTTIEFPHGFKQIKLPELENLEERIEIIKQNDGKVILISTSYYPNDDLMMCVLRYEEEGIKPKHKNERYFAVKQFSDTGPELTHCRIAYNCMKKLWVPTQTKAFEKEFTF